jgi:hypothetical protein
MRQVGRTLTMVDADLSSPERVRRAIRAIDQKRNASIGSFRWASAISGRAVHEFVAYYHLERNHQGLGNALIDGVSSRTVGTIRRRPRLGGLLNYHERAA